MSEQSRPLFREVALKQHTSPEQLDQLIQVTSAREWLVVLAVLLGVGVILCWSWFGTLTTEMTGVAVILDRSAKTIIAPTAEQVFNKQILEYRLSWLNTLSQIQEDQRAAFIQEHRHNLAKHLDNLNRQSLSHNVTRHYELAKSYALLLQMTLSEQESSLQIQQGMQTLQQQIADSI